MRIDCDENSKPEPKSSAGGASPAQPRLRAGRRWAAPLVAHGAAGAARVASVITALLQHQRPYPLCSRRHCASSAGIGAVGYGRGGRRWPAPSSSSYISRARCWRTAGTCARSTRAPPRWWLASPVRFRSSRSWCCTRGSTRRCCASGTSRPATPCTRLQMLHACDQPRDERGRRPLPRLGPVHEGRRCSPASPPPSRRRSSRSRRGSPSSGRTSAAAAAALHEHKIERYHRQMYRYVEEAINGGATSRSTVRAGGK